MPDEKTKKSMKYSLWDGAAFAVMDGIISSFLTPFAIALNASVSMIAALSYVPQILGAFAQLFASKLVEALKDRNRIVVMTSFVHALLWIPLLLIPYTAPDRKFLIVAYVSLQAVFLNLTQPIGTAIMGDMVPANERGRFFGLRNRIVGIASFMAALLAGFILDYFSVGDKFLGFTILFGIAFAARILSSSFKSMMHDTKDHLESAEKFSLADFIKRMDKTNYGHFVIYNSLFKFSVYIASPFFALYMFKTLNFTYWQFTIMVAVEMMASFIALGLWGRIIDSRGAKYVLLMTGFLVPFMPVVWLFSTNYYYLLVMELLSGFCWAGFNLSSSNFIFDAVKPENRVRCISYHKFLEGIAMFAGAAFGGFLIESVPSWVFLSGIPFVFLLSGVLRLVVSFILLPKVKEARLIEVELGHSFFKKYLAIRPNEGLVFEVIGRYNKAVERIKGANSLIREKQAKKKAPEKKSMDYGKKLLKFISTDITPKKEKHGTIRINEIERITEEIKKGRIKK